MFFISDIDLKSMIMFTKFLYGIVDAKYFFYKRTMLKSGLPTGSAYEPSSVTGLATRGGLKLCTWRSNRGMKCRAALHE
jgi:hypothetical protein